MQKFELLRSYFLRKKEKPSHLHIHNSVTYGVKENEKCQFRPFPSKWNFFGKLNWRHSYTYLEVRWKSTKNVGISKVKNQSYL